jgi:hypothetical protein
LTPVSSRPSGDVYYYYDMYIINDIIRETGEIKWLEDFIYHSCVIMRHLNFKRPTSVLYQLSPAL